MCDFRSGVFLQDSKIQYHHKIEDQRTVSDAKFIQVEFRKETLMTVREIGYESIAEIGDAFDVDFDQIMAELSNEIDNYLETL